MGFGAETYHTFRPAVLMASLLCTAYHLDEENSFPFSGHLDCSGDLLCDPKLTPYAAIVHVGFEIMILCFSIFQFWGKYFVIQVPRQPL